MLAAMKGAVKRPSDPHGPCKLVGERARKHFNRQRHKGASGSLEDTVKMETRCRVAGVRDVVSWLEKLL